MTDTKRLRRIGHAVGLECGHNAGEMIKAAAGTIDALTALAASKTEQCSALRAELDALRAATNPELLASERAANSALTGEVERLREALTMAKGELSVLGPELERIHHETPNTVAALPSSNVLPVVRAALSGEAK